MGREDSCQVQAIFLAVLRGAYAFEFGGKEMLLLERKHMYAVV